MVGDCLAFDFDLPLPRTLAQKTLFFSQNYFERGGSLFKGWKMYNVMALECKVERRSAPRITMSHFAYNRSLSSLPVNRMKKEAHTGVHRNNPLAYNPRQWTHGSIFPVLGSPKGRRPRIVPKLPLSLSLSTVLDRGGMAPYSRPQVSTKRLQSVHRVDRRRSSYL